ncbi:MAG: hypothetical protein SGJ21_09270 [Alphaproteobacteria bacterium]|nr:hypothetical protein [Alphaproteobacteria bacterium]
MSLLDGLLISAILSVSGWRVFARSASRKVVGLAVLALITLAAAQLVVEGFYWQAAPGYLLVFLLVLLTLFDVRLQVGPGRIAGQFLLAALALIALAPWTLFYPVPQLTRPDGSHAVGTEIFRWVDQARAEDATDLPGDKRNVIVQAWYTAAPGVRGAHSIYIDGLGHLPDSVSLFPGFLMAQYGQIDTHALTNAPISGEQTA